MSIASKHRRRLSRRNRREAPARIAAIVACGGTLFCAPDVAARLPPDLRSQVLVSAWLRPGEWGAAMLPGGLARASWRMTVAGFPGTWPL